MAPKSRDFEQHLEDDLRLLLDPHASGSIPAWRMPAPVRRAIPLLGGTGAALGAKVATGLVVAVLAAGATTEIAITHSANPVDWARNIQQQVQGTQQGPAHSQPSSAAHPSASPVVGGSTAASPRVGQPSLPSASAPALPSVTPSVPPLPLPSPSAPALP